MKEANDCVIIRNLNYTESEAEQVCRKPRDKLDSDVHVTSKTFLDLFLPKTSFCSDDQRQTATRQCDCTLERPEGGDLRMRFRGKPDDLKVDKTTVAEKGGRKESQSTDSVYEPEEPASPRRSTTNGQLQVDESLPGQHYAFERLKNKTGNGHDHPRETGFPRPRPLVVFVHGGGWRRGDKQTWRHYLSRWDVNLLLAAYVWKKRSDSNIGESFAGRAGFPCAVLSYPLVPTPFPINIFELFTSFLLSLLFVFASAVALGVIFEVAFILSSFESLFCEAWSVLSNRPFPTSTLLCVIVSLAQLVTLFVIVWREWYLEKQEVKPKTAPISQKSWFLKSNTILLIGGLFPTVLIIMYKFDAFDGSVATTIIFSGLLLTYVQYLNYRYQQLTTFQEQPATPFERCQSTLTSDLAAGPEGQARCIAQALRWLVDYGKLTNHFDSRCIILMGHSAGGHLVSLVALDHRYINDAGVSPDVIKGVITLSAVHDLHSISSGFPYHVYLKPAFGTDPAYWKQMSPLAYAQSSATSRSADDELTQSVECVQTSKKPQTAQTSKSFDFSPLTSKSFPNSTQTSESFRCAQLDNQLRRGGKPRFLIVTADEDFDLMTHDAERMYRALLASGYDARCDCFVGCNHFTMVYHFIGYHSGWWRHVFNFPFSWSRSSKTRQGDELPTSGERLCWDFAEGIMNCQATQ